jgi:hypothetical protein
VVLPIHTSDDAQAIAETGVKRPLSGDSSLMAELGLREHPMQGRWLRQRPSGRLVLDESCLQSG